MSSESDDLARLVGGDKIAWDRFVKRYSGLVISALRAVVLGRAELEDLTQEVLLRLCRNDYALLRRFDPTKAGMGTWLTIIARSTAHEILRRKRLPSVPIDAVPEAALATEPAIRDRVKLPSDVLTARQALILSMLYDREMDVHEVAVALEIDPQTVRSTHHKALLRLRSHFAAADGAAAGETVRPPPPLRPSSSVRGD